MLHFGLRLLSSTVTQNSRNFPVKWSLASKSYIETHKISILVNQKRTAVVRKLQCSSGHETTRTI